MNQGDENGLGRLRVIMKAVSLRRTKALLAARLPPKTVYVRPYGAVFSRLLAWAPPSCAAHFGV
jgi:hypothetical protein